MPWFHVDDRFASHPKVLATSLAARGLWVTAGSWSSAHLTDGVVPGHVLASLGGTPALAAELVTAGLWRRRRGGNYVFHDWKENGSPTKEAVEKERKAAAERQRRSRADRASRRDKPVSHTVSHGATSTSYGSTTGRARGTAAAARAPGQKPPWCGECDERTRLTGDPPQRCELCHPLVRTP